ncbi:MAG: hypothetical protein J6V80_01005 [Clostridia bacterium]|nr:hypothetical protein [Clostridia bacterium]
MGLTRLISLLLAFIIGFVSCAGVLVGGAYAALTSFRVRDIEKYGLAQIPDELFMGENYEVDLLNLSAFEMIDELKILQTHGDDLNLNLLIKRYDLKLHHKIDQLLSEEAKQIPLSEMFSDEGVHELLSTVYIGYAQNYECHAIDSTELVDPALGKEGARWYDPAGDKYITGIASTIAFFTLDDFASGSINMDSVLHGIVLADVFGYTYELDENGKKIWYDKNGEKITGIMAVFADCTLDNVDEKINTVAIGELIGYEELEEGIWYSKNEETGELEKVHGFMNAVANNSINTLGGMFDDLTIGDLVPEDERTGIFTIISPDSKLNEISGSINDSIQNSPMQFFMNQGMITFEAAQQQSLDAICYAQEKVNVFSPEDENFIKYYADLADQWTMDNDGNYLVPSWRAQPLTNSFSYIVSLLAPTPDANLPESGEENT